MLQQIMAGCLYRFILFFYFKPIAENQFISQIFVVFITTSSAAGFISFHYTSSQLSDCVCRLRKKIWICVVSSYPVAKAAIYFVTENWQKKKLSSAYAA
jgi:hypothetical protein